MGESRTNTVLRAETRELLNAFSSRRFLMFFVNFIHGTLPYRAAVRNGGDYDDTETTFRTNSHCGGTPKCSDRLPSSRELGWFAVTRHVLATVRDLL